MVDVINLFRNISVEWGHLCLHVLQFHCTFYGFSIATGIYLRTFDKNSVVLFIILSNPYNISVFSRALSFEDDSQWSLVDNFDILFCHLNYSRINNIVYGLLLFAINLYFIFTVAAAIIILSTSWFDKISRNGFATSTSASVYSLLFSKKIEELFFFRATNNLKIIILKKIQTWVIMWCDRDRDDILNQYG